jgi:hypothetical protein
MRDRGTEGLDLRTLFFLQRVLLPYRRSVRVPVRLCAHEQTDENRHMWSHTGAALRVHVRRLRQGLHSGGPPRHPHAEPHGRAALRVHARRLRQGLRSDRQPHRPHADPHWREALRVHARRLRQGLRSDEQPHISHAEPHRRAALRVQARRLRQGLRSGRPSQQAHADPRQSGMEAATPRARRSRQRRAPCPAPMARTECSPDR